jgi:hypothetical protein
MVVELLLLRLPESRATCAERGAGPHRAWPRIAAPHHHQIAGGGKP